MRTITSENRSLRNACTVADLIAELESMDQDAIVLFACDYGDYHHTQQALPVASVQELSDEEVLVESAYSRSGLAIEEVGATAGTARAARIAA